LNYIVHLITLILEMTIELICKYPKFSKNFSPGNKFPCFHEKHLFFSKGWRESVPQCFSIAQKTFPFCKNHLKHGSSLCTDTGVCAGVGVYPIPYDFDPRLPKKFAPSAKQGFTHFPRKKNKDHSRGRQSLGNFG
jgi:hypothetical protein